MMVLTAEKINLTFNNSWMKCSRYVVLVADPCILSLSGTLTATLATTCLATQWRMAHIASYCQPLHNPAIALDSNKCTFYNSCLLPHHFYNHFPRRIYKFYSSFVNTQNHQNLFAKRRMFTTIVWPRLGIQIEHSTTAYFYKITG